MTDAQMARGLTLLQVRDLIDVRKPWDADPLRLIRDIRDFCAAEARAIQPTEKETP